jgi:predicted ester cyclase
MSEENKAVVRQIEEAWNANALDKLDQYFAPNFHQNSRPPGAPDTLEGAKAVHGMTMAAFPDRRTTIEDMVAEGDKVAVRVRMQGTNTGGMPWFGVPANDKPVDIEWISIYTLANGKATEHRAIIDIMGMMMQLGMVQPPA